MTTTAKSNEPLLSPEDEALLFEVRESMNLDMGELELKVLADIKRLKILRESCTARVLAEKFDIPPRYVTHLLKARGVELRRINWTFSYVQRVREEG